MYAHGGMFRTAGVAQRFLAGALDAPVTVATETASEGGAWGVAVLAAFAAAGGGELASYLDDTVFTGPAPATAEPDAGDVAGFANYLDRYRAGLDVERAAIAALPRAAL
jgi:sugar (pentulose or hexulose) kinase